MYYENELNNFKIYFRWIFFRAFRFEKYLSVSSHLFWLRNILKHFLHIFRSFLWAKTEKTRIICLQIVDQEPRHLLIQLNFSLPASEDLRAKQFLFFLGFPRKIRKFSDHKNRKIVCLTCWVFSQSRKKFLREKRGILS